MIDDSTATVATAMRRHRRALSVLCCKATEVTFLVHFIVTSKQRTEFSTADHE